MTVSFPTPGGPWPAIRRDLERPNRRGVVAVVAYIGKDAPQVMPLRAGDVLVCDASDAAIKGRMTSVAALRTFQRRGVGLFSIDGLHAKVIASPTAAWVGSANASDNSENELIEAAARVTQDQARNLHKWARSLATEDASISSSELRRLSQLKLSPPRRNPRKTVLPKELPSDARRLVIWRLGGEASDRELAAIAREEPLARRDARFAGVPSVLDPVPFAGGTEVKKGDWLVTVSRGRVQPIGFIVRITQEGKTGRVWLSRVPCKHKPPIAVVRELVPETATDFLEVVVRKKATVDAVLDAFR